MNLIVFFPWEIIKTRLSENADLKFVIQIQFISTIYSFKLIFSFVSIILILFSYYSNIILKLFSYYSNIILISFSYHFHIIVILFSYYFNIKATSCPIFNWFFNFVKFCIFAVSHFLIIQFVKEIFMKCCSIHWQLLSWGLRTPTNECPGYDTKQSDGEVPVMLELRGMWSTPLFPSLPGLLWPGVVAPDKALELTTYLC